MLRWLGNLFRPKPKPPRFKGPYRVFTTEYDRLALGEELAAVVQENLDPRFFAPANVEAIDDEAAVHYEAPAATLVAALKDHPLDCLVTLLLDHSGSTRGNKICQIAVAAGVLSECFTRLGIVHEVLGFTTTSWHGGKSARAWKALGSPPAPGRLCDLLHVVHRPFTATAALDWETMERMTNPHLLKENIDGEALLWAASRLRAQRGARKLLITISDGAPVDDATILANGPNILDDHMRLVCADLIASGDVELYGVGIEYGMARYCPQYCVINETADIGRVAVPVVQALLASDLNRPLPQQITPR
jgi:cobaltochelatase CobT